MKIAHLAAVTPGQCGLWETTREIVLAEQSQGIDARIIDTGNWCESNEVKRAAAKMMPYFRNLGDAAGLGVKSALEYMKKNKVFEVKPKEKGYEDRGVVIEDTKWLDEADIIVGHSGFPPDMQTRNDVPYIMCCHGRPKSSFLLEWSGQYPVYFSYTKMNKDVRVRRFVTFWNEHIPQLSMIIDPNKLAYIPACVDMERFNPEGETHPFEKMGKRNIVICDIWREDIDPYQVVHNCHYFCKKNPEWKFHVFGAKPQKELGPWNILLGECQKQGTLGEVAGLVKEIEQVYRTADMMVTPHRIATRTVRECLASGLPLVAEEGNPYTPYHAPTWDTPRFIREMERCAKNIEISPDTIKYKMIKSAKDNFSMENTGKAMCALFEDVLEEWTNNISILTEKKHAKAVVI